MTNNDKKSIKPCTVLIRPFGSTVIRPVGTTTLKTSWYGSIVKAEWLVVDDSKLNRHIDPIISKSLAIALKMITLDSRLLPYAKDSNTKHENKRDSALYASELPLVGNPADMGETNQNQKWIGNNCFRECFHGLGLLRKHIVQLFLKHNAKPFISPPRPHPYYLQPQINEAIAQMLQDDVIEDHDGPAEWISNLAIVLKDRGAIRISVDLRGLNAELRDTQIPILTPDTIKLKLANCKVFSKLDFKQAFHQLELANESRPLTVFRCGARLYRYKRLSMGLKPESCRQHAQKLEGFTILTHHRPLLEGFKRPLATINNSRLPQL
ncbi:uncharacterized protein K02A2.6-like [Tigriopus californicus]|uniref:uncharacterized protein K02A2.6-like n=1 Tax=Tigriopus californicus TaxID=6832 RepID=UPI0027DAA162|nr:uncharacterized protein K02A2.6-like [Tigriopus californicus]